MLCLHICEIVRCIPLTAKMFNLKAVSLMHLQTAAYELAW